MKIFAFLSIILLASATKTAPRRASQRQASPTVSQEADTVSTSNQRQQRQGAIQFVASPPGQATRRRTRSHRTRERSRSPPIRAAPRSKSKGIIDMKGMGSMLVSATNRHLMKNEESLGLGTLDHKSRHVEGKRVDMYGLSIGPEGKIVATVAANRKAHVKVTTFDGGAGHILTTSGGSETKHQIGPNSSAEAEIVAHGHNAVTAAVGGPGYAAISGYSSDT